MPAVAEYVWPSAINSPRMNVSGRARAYRETYRANSDGEKSPDGDGRFFYSGRKETVLLPSLCATLNPSGYLRSRSLSSRDTRSRDFPMNHDNSYDDRPSPFARIATAGTLIAMPEISSRADFIAPCIEIPLPSYFSPVFSLSLSLLVHKRNALFCIPGITFVPASFVRVGYITGKIRLFLRDINTSRRDADGKFRQCDVSFSGSGLKEWLNGSYLRNDYGRMHICTVNSDNLPL